MSYRHANAIRDCRLDLRPNERLVALVISLYIDDKKGYGFCSKRRMAEDCGMTTQTWGNVARRLRLMGLFETRETFRDNGSQAVNEWSPGENFPPVADIDGGGVSGKHPQGVSGKHPQERSDRKNSPRRSPQGDPVAEAEKMVLEVYDQERGNLQKIVPARWPGSQHQRHLLARLKERPEHQTERFWRVFFKVARENPTWNGENQRGWRASLSWLVNRTNFDKVVERWANQS